MPYENAPLTVGCTAGVGVVVTVMSTVMFVIPACASDAKCVRHRSAAPVSVANRRDIRVMLFLGDWIEIRIWRVRQAAALMT